MIAYRQKGAGTRWMSLAPGQKIFYTWDEPLKSHKLSVRISGTTKSTSTKAHEKLNEEIQNASTMRKLLNQMKMNKVHSRKFNRFKKLIRKYLVTSKQEDYVVRHFKLDQVDASQEFPCRDTDGKDGASLKGTIAADGPTRVLEITSQSNLQITEVSSSLHTTEKRISEIKNIMIQYDSTMEALKESSDEFLKEYEENNLESMVKIVQDDLNSDTVTISNINQLFVQVFYF